ncbi:thioesterase II family protein [Streptomyces sp. AP-93]|uniref:thioesterase II family protein n=1 Tax=Streptomyces sp. AP-93 TaxID=2929048 RepID=UPI001FAF151D|nr:alpha/beta fold hydrolase [Streptomyces sp. AP-93]MCJ0873072.1 alpha/beta fold hydrolase [Streptomyces sp. AP-93]
MSQRTPLDDSWLRRFAPAAQQSTVRLVCFPHAGGSAGWFRPLTQALTPRVEGLAVQYPGRQDRRRERLVDSVQELADAAFAALRRELEPPFAFFGHSLGAVVAFEVARRFEQLTPAGPVRLFASARRAPSVVRDETVHLRDDAGLIHEMIRLGGTEEGVLDDSEIRQMVLPVVRADYRAIETYRAAPGARITCPVSVLVGDRDPVTPVADAAAWGAHTTKGTDLHVFAGGHFYLEPKITEVAAAIDAAL